MTRRRRWKKKAALLIILIAAVLALLYAQCGSGFGFGTGRDDATQDDAKTNAIQPVLGEDSPTETAAKPACEVRVDANGLTVNGAVCPEGEIAACCGSDRAQLTVTGDARQGDADLVRDRLRKARIETLERQPSDKP